MSSDASNLPLFPSLKTIAIVSAVFIAAGLFVYGPSLGNQFVTWDDELLITENQTIKTLSVGSIKQAFTSYDPELYIPLTFVSYQIDHAIGGEDPFVYHLHSIGLHIVNALLVTLLLFLLFNQPWIPIFCGLLFLVHPLNVEAAAWASARKDVLSMFFSLGSLITYCWYCLRSQRKWLWASIAFFVLALGAKVTIILLPLALVLIDAHYHRPLDRRLFIEKIPFALLTIAFGIIAMFGKGKVLAASSTASKFWLGLKSIAVSLGHFIWPSNLSVMYPQTTPVSLFSPDIALSAVVVIVLAVLIVLSLKRTPRVLIGAAFFMLMLLPTFINVTKGGDTYFTSDRYVYAAMIGLLYVVATLIEWLHNRPVSYRFQSKRTNLIAGILVLIIGIFAVQARTQALTWRTSETLYVSVIESYPAAHAAHNNLGLEYLAQGKFTDAEQEFMKSLIIRDDPYARLNLASAYLKLNRPADAMREYQQVIDADPSHATAYYGLGTIAQSQGKVDEAADYYAKAIEKDPKQSMAYNNLGAIMLRRENWAAAIDAFSHAIAINPEFPEAEYNLGVAYEQNGQLAEAIQAYEAATALNPNDIYALLGSARLYFKTGNLRIAADRVLTILKKDPGNAEAIELGKQIQAASVQAR